MYGSATVEETLSNYVVLVDFGRAHAKRGAARQCTPHHFHRSFAASDHPSQNKKYHMLVGFEVVSTGRWAFQKKYVSPENRTRDNVSRSWKWREKASWRKNPGEIVLQHKKTTRRRQRAVGFYLCRICSSPL
jgi:hypothetical protein